MARPDEKRFKARGSEWVARFDFNAVCDIEERSGKPFMEFVAPFFGSLEVKDKDNPKKIMQAMKGLRMSDLRTVLHQTLLEKQPNTTLADAGQIISDIGFEGTVEIVAWAMMKGMGQEGDASGDANPPKAD